MLEKNDYVCKRKGGAVGFLNPIYMKFTAVGDMLVQRRLPGEYEGFSEVSKYIKKGDMRFFNLETTLHKGDCYASQFSGGSWLWMYPEVLEDAQKFGFNMLSFANNHTMDYSYGGLIKTLDAVNEFNTAIIVTPTSANIAAHNVVIPQALKISTAIFTAIAR